MSDIVGKSVFKIIFIIGIVFIMIDLIRTYNKCPPQKTIYRYIPRTFIEEQENPIPLDDIFYTMFNNPSPWVNSVDIARRRNDIGENLNKYYISQI
jgi:hypothetical protein